MPTLQKRGTSWRAIVRKHGRYASDSFATKTEARNWALAKELEFAAERRGDIPSDKTVADLIERYLEEQDPDRPTRLRLQRTRTNGLGEVRLSEFSGQDVARWRDDRLKEVSAASVLREWNTLSSICTRAVKEWRWLRDNPFRDAERPAAPQPRSRRPQTDEIDRILYCLGYRPDALCHTKNARVGAAALWAIETGMRAGEICALRPEHVRGRVAHLEKTKNGHPRDVPLSKQALAVWAQLPAGHFDLNSGTVDALWRRARDKALVEGLTFHDLRREALTRLSKKFDVLELARISGHRDLRVLLQVYYRPSMADLAGKLDD